MKRKTKRANLEGSVFQRKDGRWCAVTSAPREYFYGRSQATAIRKRDKEQARRGTAVLALGENQPLSKYLATWLTSIRHRVKPRTADGYESIARNHIEPVIGDVPLRKVAPKHIQAVIDAAAAKGLSGSIQWQARRLLLQSLEHARRMRLIIANPVGDTDAPKRNPQRVDAMMTGELQAFLAAARSDLDVALLLIYVLVGLRRGEALALEWSDFDAKARTIYVHRSVQRYGGELHVDDVKTESGRRVIRLPRVIAAALRLHRYRQRAARESARDAWQECGLMFPSTVGTLREPRNIYRTMDRVLKAAGLTHKRIHALRHTALTHLLARGADVKNVQSISGHASAKVLLDTYAHRVPSDQAAELMDTISRDATAKRVRS